MSAIDLGRRRVVERDFAGPFAASPAGAAMIGYRDGGGLDLRVAGVPAVTLVIEFGDGELVVDDADGSRALGGFVVGLPAEAMRIRTQRAECIEVRLSPIQAYSLLGVPPAELGRAAVGMEELWGRQARQLREQLAAATTWEERFALTKSFLTQRVRPMRVPDPEVIAGWHRVLASRGQVRVAELAESLAWSRQRLWARFESQIGLTPKRAAMLVRFRYAVDGLLAGRPAADVAATCGYTDQAHLCRDVSIFANHTPGALTANYLPAIARERYRAWGTFFQYQAAPVSR
ncbi:helix-turn-helix domain-containing protein [Nocardia thraciensis]